MSSHNWYLRVVIVLAMVVASVTILYLTPMPDQNFKSCERPCHELDWPMICRIKLTLEQYQTMTSHCNECPLNSTDCTISNCIVADGISRPIITANRQLPGPSIQVCQNDVIVVDVINKLPGQSVSLHWRGQSHYEVPSMDGVPMITQCPIPSYTTFQYKFRASQAGTHLWQANSGGLTSEGLFGALIVRQSNKLEPHRSLYDVDSNKHVILVSEWSNKLIFQNLLQHANPDMDSVLINGIGVQKDSDEDFSVKEFFIEQKKRYRFRVAFPGGPGQCSMKLSIDKHILKVIALDGHPIVPREASSIIFNRGERVDFVLTANQSPGAYWLKVKTAECDFDVTGAAMVRYTGSEELNMVDVNSEGIVANKKFKKFTTTSVCENTKGNVCINTVQSLDKMEEKLKQYEPDVKIWLPFDFVEDFGESGRKVGHINNKTFTYPSAPLLTQRDEVVAANVICDSNTQPEQCGQDAGVCECVHVRKVPLGSSVELILADLGGDLENHVFHMHGHSMWVVGARQLSDDVMSWPSVQEMDKEGALFKRNLVNPPRKDTVTVPRYGVVAVRFLADNPGVWMLQEEHSGPWSRGLDMVVQVGEPSEFQHTPDDFPKCGDWVGPQFFLT